MNSNTEKAEKLLEATGYLENAQLILFKLQSEEPREDYAEINRKLYQTRLDLNREAADLREKG